jgi:cytochrome c oxidase assembly protein subunit 15
LHAVDAARSRINREVIGGALWLFGVVALQATLGILTLLNQAPMDLALAHQAVAIIVLTLAVFQAERLTRTQREPIVQGIGQPATQTG